MKPLTILAMTSKGHAVVSSIFAAHDGMIDAVVGSRDKNLVDDGFEPLADFCGTHGIRFHERADAPAIRTEYTLAVAWRWLVDGGRSRLIVFHDSLLPRYRGFNPLVTALVNGDTEIGVTALYAAAEYDRGDVIAQSASTIAYPITIQAAVETLLANYKDLALRVAASLARDEDPGATPQSEEGASYSLWRDDDDYFIDWTKPAATIRRTIDAMGFPYKGAASRIDGKVARIVRAEALSDVNIANRSCGKVVFIQGEKPVVVCGVGLLRIDELVDEAGRSLLPLARFRT